MPKRRSNPRSLANLRPPWKPRQSGNPGGRPKRDEAALLARAIFEHNPEAIYKAMLKALKKGSGTVFIALADRGYGKAPHHVSFSEKDGGAIPVTVEGIDAALMKLLEAAESRKTGTLKEGEFGNRTDAHNCSWPQP